MSLPANVHRKGKGYRAIVQVDGQQLRSRTFSTPGAAAAEVERLRSGTKTQEEQLCAGVRAALAAPAAAEGMSVLAQAYQAYCTQVSQARKRGGMHRRPALDQQLEVLRQQVMALLDAVQQAQQVSASIEGGVP